MRLRHLPASVAYALFLVGCGEAADSPTSVRVPEQQLAVLSSSRCELGSTEADARTAVDAVRAQVDALQEGGALNRGQSRALHNKLDKALEHVEAGRLCPALAQLRAFLEQVENFVRDDVLSGAEAAPLLAGVRAVLEGEAATPGLRFVSISAGEFHTCGLTASGAAHCWGANGAGQIGDGTTTRRLVPTPVNGGQNFASISAGGGYTCGLESGGEAFCWGDNLVGKLGDGTTTNRHLPTPVSGGHTFASVSAGEFHTCGLVADGAAYCWGWNAFGALGDGTMTDRFVPTPVVGGHLFVSVAAGGSSCGLEADGQAYCWGFNGDGQLGDGTQVHRAVPTLVSGGHVFAAISPAHFRTCGIEIDGDGFCWGLNSGGSLGTGTTAPLFALVPTPVAGGHGFGSLSVGPLHACALDVDGRAFCWGNNGWGQLGDGTTTDRMVPVPVSGDDLFTSISVARGGEHTCGVDVDGISYCWGRNGDGQLGDGTTTDRRVPTVVIDGT